MFNSELLVITRGYFFLATMIQNDPRIDGIRFRMISPHVVLPDTKKAMLDPTPQIYTKAHLLSKEISCWD